MMYLAFFALMSVLVVLSGCTESAPEIRTVCTRDEIGNYIVKWEISPKMEGTMYMYMSDDPENFDMTTPVKYSSIDEGVATYITDDNFKRKYFCLTFNDKYPQIVGTNIVKMDSVQNLRDIGGYSSKNRKHIKWGKIYRSGEITGMSEWDSVRMANLGIKTIIDLRMPCEIEENPIVYRHANVVSVPVSRGNTDMLSEQIMNNRIRKGDSFLYMQDMYKQFVTDNSEQLAKIFDMMLDKDNYPILYCCPLGKDRTGFLTALLLSMLDIPKETIMGDYLESNNNIDAGCYFKWVYKLLPDTQEAVTLMISARESFLSYALNYIVKEYGSMHNYFEKELNITDKEQEELQRLLLY